MKSIPIYIYDTAIKEKIQELIDENESLGFEKNKNIPKESVKYDLVKFWFDEDKLIGYWIDNSINDDTKTLDIIFYIGSTSFRTPYTDENRSFFNLILDNHKKE